MRGATGFSKNDEGSHWSPRETFPPDKGLQLHIFEWVEEGLAQVHAANARDNKERPTTITFLNKVKNLRSVIQGATILMKDRWADKKICSSCFQCFNLLSFKHLKMLFGIMCRLQRTLRLTGHESAT
jgi:hypothetical protein